MSDVVCPRCAGRLGEHVFHFNEYEYDCDRCGCEFYYEDGEYEVVYEGWTDSKWHVNAVDNGVIPEINWGLVVIVIVSALIILSFILQIAGV